MTATSQAPAAEAAVTLMTTDQAIDWLKARGIHTSRQGLDRRYRAGELKRVRTRGRHRVMYQAEELLACFVIGVETCPSASPSAERSGTSAALTSDKAYMRALALAGRPTPT